MYIIKNALKCISRSKGRNILIGTIVLVIAISACLGLSIRQAAESAKTDTMDTMSITAVISFDRQSMMSEMMGDGGAPFDRDQFASLMGETSGLTIEEYQKYATSPSVQDFYYSMTVSMNGSDTFEAVSAETTDSDEDSFSPPGGFGGFGGMMGGQDDFSGDFSIVGYSTEAAMTSFQNGTTSITEGAIFAEDQANYECIITEELAIFNDLSVGDRITLSNPIDEMETYELTISGIYADASTNEGFAHMGRFGATSMDPANKIYMSAATLEAITDHSEAVAVTDIDSAGVETSTKLTGAVSATYVFANAEDYYQFEKDVRKLGLDESYIVSSSDVRAFENSLVPLNTLSSMAMTFLIVILVIGAIILVVLNIFNIRERKYEIGVLCAMGMKKGKVAAQFLTEIFVVTLAAVLIGVCVGAVSSVPVTNALLENQVASQKAEFEQIESNFGRGPMGNRGEGGRGDWGDRGESDEDEGDRGQGGFGGMMGGPQGMGDRFSMLFGGNAETSYVTEISSAMNFTVVLQMLGIAILLTLVSGAVSMIFVMRYDPLKILANRD